MNGFLPDSYSSAVGLAGWIAIAAPVGFFLQGRPSFALVRMLSWLLALGVPLIFSLWTQVEPGGYRMLVIVIALFFGMKILAGLEGTRPLKFPRWLIFFFCWPGMRSQVFSESRRPRTQIAVTALAGMYRLLAGIAIIFVAVRLAEPVNIWMASAMMLIGISLIMHFGVFNLNAALLRLAGFDCRPLFREPLKANTLNEFWSRRWNLAYSEMIALTVFRPLASRIGPGVATMASFACSGLFHEMAISLPVMRGFGLPMLYFLIQGAFILFEQKFKLSPTIGKILTVLVVFLPVPILFHPWFLAGVVVPILR